MVAINARDLFLAKVVAKNVVLCIGVKDYLDVLIKKGVICNEALLQIITDQNNSNLAPLYNATKNKTFRCRIISIVMNNASKFTFDHICDLTDKIKPSNKQYGALLSLLICKARYPDEFFRIAKKISSFKDKAAYEKLLVSCAKKQFTDENILMFQSWTTLIFLLEKYEMSNSLLAQEAKKFLLINREIRKKLIML